MKILKNGGEKQIVWFLYPADDKGVAFLKIEHKNKDDEMRMWLPELKKSIKIKARKKTDSFMGSDLSYEDMSNRDIDENTYKLLKEESCGEKKCYIIEIVPKKTFTCLTTSAFTSYFGNCDYSLLSQNNLIQFHFLDMLINVFWISAPFTILLKKQLNNSPT